MQRRERGDHTAAPAAPAQCLRDDQGAHDSRGFGACHGGRRHDGESPAAQAEGTGRGRGRGQRFCSELPRQVGLAFAGDDVREFERIDFIERHRLAAAGRTPVTHQAAQAHETHLLVELDRLLVLREYFQQHLAITARAGSGDRFRHHLPAEPTVPRRGAHAHRRDP